MWSSSNSQLQGLFSGEGNGTIPLPSTLDIFYENWKENEKEEQKQKEVEKPKPNLEGNCGESRWCLHPMIEAARLMAKMATKTIQKSDRSLTRQGPAWQKTRRVGRHRTHSRSLVPFIVNFSFSFISFSVTVSFRRRWIQKADTDTDRESSFSSWLLPCARRMASHWRQQKTVTGPSSTSSIEPPNLI